MAVNLSQISREKKQLWNFINSKLQAHFDKEIVDLSERIRLEADLEKWRPEVEEFWKQKKEGNHYSIYFDDEFACSFDFDDPPGVVEVKFLRGFKELFEDEKIYLDVNDYKIKAELDRLQKEEKERKLKAKTGNKDVDKVIKDLNENAK